jgi:cell division protein FtsB
MMRPVTMLAGVAVVLVILLAPYLRPWLAQRSDIAGERARVEALQRQVDQLQVERSRWDNPDFVKAQARERLNFVMPGELGYVVLNDTPQAKPADPAKQAVLDTGRITGRPWYDVLWRSIQLAGRPASSPGQPAPGQPAPGQPAPGQPAPGQPARNASSGPALSTSRTP